MNPFLASLVYDRPFQIARKSSIRIRNRPKRIPNHFAATMTVNNSRPATNSPATKSNWQQPFYSAPLRKLFLHLIGACKSLFYNSLRRCPGPNYPSVGGGHSLCLHWDVGFDFCRAFDAARQMAS